MADHSHEGGQGGHMDMAAHRGTYEGFLRGSILTSLMCLMVCIALVMFRFGHGWSVFLGFAGLIVGVIALLIDLRSGSAKWALSVGWAVIFGLITAINII